MRIQIPSCVIYILLVFLYCFQIKAGHAQTQLGGDIDGEASFDFSGASASINSSGNRIVIGAPDNSDGGTNAGHIRAYELIGGAWVQLGSDIDGSGSFFNLGQSVSMNAAGNRVAAGIPNAAASGLISAGFTRIYEWNGAVWNQLGNAIQGNSAGDNSGWNIDLDSSGNTIAIGARLADGINGLDVGSVRVFDWNGTGWIQRGSAIEGEQFSDRFGQAVAISSNGDRFIAGGPYNDAIAGNAGHARIFEWNGSSWIQLGSDIDGSALNDYLGWSVDMSASGDTVIVGAYRSSVNGGSAGEARVYTWNGTSWNQLGNSILGVAAGDNFGESVSISKTGEIIAVGATNNDNSNGVGSGHTRIYKWTTGCGWVQQGTDINGESSFDDSGKEVSLSFTGDTIIVGAEENDGGGTQSGHARVFQNLNNSNPVITVDDSCVNTPISFGLTNTTILDSVIWDFDNGTTDTVFSVPTTQVYTLPGNFTVEAIVYANCEVDTLQFALSIQTGPIADLGLDSVLCEGVFLSNSVQNSTYSYTWSTGSVSDSIVVTQPGSYAVTVTDGCGFSSDTLVVDSIILSTVSLPNDSTICTGDTLSVAANLPAGTFSWSTGDTTQGIEISSPGAYQVTATNLCGTSIDSFFISSLPPPSTDLGPDTTICPSLNLQLNAIDTVSTYLWNNGSTSPTITVSSSGTYTVSVTNQCGIDSDSITVGSLIFPNVSLGLDTTLCVGDSFTLSAGNQNVSYVWSTGDTSSSILVNQNGVYTVQATNACGTSSDTLQVSSITSPNPQLGNDTIICNGNVLNWNVAEPNSSYVWQDGLTDSTNTASTNGLFSVTVTNGCGQSSDSIQVTVDSILHPNLGSDTILCPGDQLTLNSGISAATYLWSTGDTSQDITVNTSGLYSITANNACGTEADSIAVLYDSIPIVDLGIDGAYCSDNRLVLSAAWPDAGYQWQDGSMDSTLQANTDGFYAVTVTGRCGAATDSIQITYHDPFILDIGADTILCVDDSILITTQVNNATYSWNTGSTASSIWGYPGNTYEVQVTNACGSQIADVDLNSLLPPGAIGTETDTLCEGEQLQAQIELNIPATITWFDGSTDSTRIFNESGSYSYTIENQCGSQSGSYDVVVEAFPRLDFDDEYQLCFGEELLLEAPDGEYMYQWTTGDTTRTLEFNQAGVYTISVTTSAGCRTIEDFEITDCGVQLYVPNAFSPNGDGINDEFEVVALDIDRYSIRIFDRWGSVVYYSTDSNASWDGIHYTNDTPCNQAVYTYRIWYGKKDYDSRELLGKLTLLR